MGEEEKIEQDVLLNQPSVCEQVKDEEKLEQPLKPVKTQIDSRGKLFVSFCFRVKSKRLCQGKDETLTCLFGTGVLGKSCLGKEGSTPSYQKTVALVDTFRS